MTVYVIKDTGPWYTPKCDRCDDDRMIHFTSPSGKDYSELCPHCGKAFRRLAVEEGSAYSLAYVKECGLDWYAFDLTMADGDRACMKMENKADGKSFEDVSRMMDLGRVFFLSKDNADAFVQWANKDLPGHLVREDGV